MSGFDLTANLVDSTAETHVLGSILIDPDCMEKVGFLVAKDFYHTKNRIIFQAMKDLHDQNIPIDFVTLVDKLSEGEAGKEGWGPVEVADLMSSVPTAMYADHYAKIVQKHGRLRSVVRMGEKIVKTAFEPDADPDNLIARSIAAFERLAGEADADKVSDMNAIMLRQLERLKLAMSAYESGKPLGLFTGWALDKITGGFQDGNVVTIAARPGAGKSSFGIAMLLRLAQRGFGGVYISLEMSEAEIVDKMIANYSQIDSLKLRNGQLDDADMTKWIDAANELYGLPISILDNGCTTLGEIKRKLRVLKQQNDIKFVVIDYVQLMSAGAGDDVGKGENRVQVISAISRGIKQMAKELNLVVFMISQLNRAVEQRQDKRPMLSDLRESGSIEQDSDSVIMLYRDDYYNDDSSEPNIAEVIVCKNRHGDTGTRKMYFRREICSFSDVDVVRIEMEG